MNVRRLWVVVCAAALAVVVTACGGSSSPHAATGQLTGHMVADANNDGTYVEAGGITYQMQISRELNPYSAEDSAYVKGLPLGIAGPGPSQLWYGVFLWAKNQHHRAYTTARNFVIEDTQGNKYYPVALSSANAYAWTPQTLQYNETFPGPDSTASLGATQGALLLFKLSDSVYDNRPLTLYILGSDRQRLGSISLNL